MATQWHTPPLHRVLKKDRHRFAGTRALLCAPVAPWKPLLESVDGNRDLIEPSGYFPLDKPPLSYTKAVFGVLPTLVAERVAP